MKEFKFRAWDTIRNKYVALNNNVHNHKTFGQGVSPQIYNLDNYMTFGLQGKIFYGEQYNLQYEQFTTIRDDKRTDLYPNGQEIFENDILEITQDDSVYRTVVKDFNNGFSVEVIGCYFDFTALPWLSDVMPDCKVEIVGNMNETPWLLKEIKKDK